MGSTANLNLDYGTRRQNPWWDIWQALWVAVDAAINEKFKILASDPVAPTEGQTWYNTTDHHYKGYNGTEIVLLG